VWGGHCLPARGIGRVDLREQLESVLQGRVCLMGLGNTDYGDDGFGVRLGEGLLDLGMADVILAGTAPDRHIGTAADQDFDHLVFLDAVEFGGKPGSVVFLDAEGIASRFPQISTHKISLSVLARLIESNGITKTWLLGVQPESTRGGEGLSPKVRATLEVLCALLSSLKTKELPVC